MDKGHMAWEGRYWSVRELAERYGINENILRARIYRTSVEEALKNLKPVKK